MLFADADAVRERRANRETLVMNGVRVDKWLWASRFFKTRSLAARACALGRIQCNRVPAKPSRELRVGDVLQIKNEAGEFEISILILSDIRGPAAVAQTLYQETEESEKRRAKAAEERKAMPYVAGLREGRPSKRDRRDLSRFLGRH